jgi:hypothetical protein
MAEDTTDRATGGLTENRQASLPVPEDGGEQEHQGLTPRHQRVAGLLTKLATTARSFLLYDAGNETIHRFLKALLDSFVSALAEEGRVHLVVTPFELRFEGQVVYLNRDRERSLAFRLYRDGVRAVVFENGFGWEELARLLEILSIRYTGIHQREDDMVTLLWKADFDHLEVVAVEAIVPEDGADPAEAHPSPEASAGAPIAHLGLPLPDDLDLPRPALPPPVGPTWVAVSESSCAALRAEASPAALADDCLALVEDLRRQLADDRAPLCFAEAVHLFQEIRDYLLVDHRLAALKRLLAVLWEMAEADPPPWDPGRHAATYDLIESFGDRRAVRRLLRSVPADRRKMEPELLEVLDRACPDALAAVVDALAEEQGAAARAVARQILEHYGARQPEELQRRFLAAEGRFASDLLRVIAGIGGDGCVQFVAQQAQHRDPAVQDEALWHLGRMPYSGSVGRALLEVFRHADGPRRARVLEMIARTGDRRFVEHLADHVEEQAKQLTIDEAAQVGRVLGALGGEETIPLWRTWLQPVGGHRRGLQGPLQRVVAGALALAEIPGEPAAEALGVAFDYCDEESQPWILGALAQRQRAVARKTT